ncbi:TRAP transporter large permease [Ruixingdingia sedimenti]|uniref:TRAP transporter large permease protein n=1 Tax=Ruixingdingia sedimenti TaxID=3073604 RepID=A0ABU1F934_9RHOB|nr:TRAP transporter large permease [Xinfangfangia sp. LG-4]MDR5653403.1 TRAP transporter large permease [Xinfangfangia sp. LG-4]
MIGAIFAALPLLLTVAGVPIFIILLAVTALGINHLGTADLRIIHTSIFGGLDSFPMLAIPLFIFAGDVMAQGGIARRLIRLILSLVGGIPGSMGVAAIGSASVFGAMSGSSVACVAAIGRLTVPTLIEQGYGRRFSGSLIAATGVIDIIIPPSIAMILYGITAQVSVTQLFVAGVVPGIMIAALLSLYVMVRASVMGTVRSARPQLPVVLGALRDSTWAMFAPVLILGGIYGGIFTPTEAAGIACTYSIIVSVFIYKELSWADIWRIATSSSVLVAQIMLLVAASSAFGWLVTTSGLPQKFMALIQGMNLSVWAMLLIFNVVLLLVGSLLDPPPAILILVPLLAPVVQAAGIDPIHFGLVVTINLAIGMFLPPFGINLFAANALFKIPLGELYRGVLPFLVIYLIVLGLITYIPELTTVPVGFIMGLTQ